MRLLRLAAFMLVLTAGCNLPSGDGENTPPYETSPQTEEQPAPRQEGPAVETRNSPQISGCPVFPADNVWNVPIDQLPVDPNSDVYIDTIGSGIGLHPDFGSGEYEGGPIGIPYMVVSGGQATSEVEFDYDDESDPGPYPIPDNPLIEGGSDSDGDRHILLIDSDNCILYELFYAFPEGDGNWSAASGAIFDLTTNDMRPDGWTSADAAGLPILPGLVRYDEILAGEITHALRFTASETRREYIWPARHFASDLTDSQYPPMGLRLRLKSDVDISGYSPEVQVILRALQKYGMILADNGSPWFISGTPDERWDNDALRELGQITGADFEVVDTSSLMIDPDSAQANVPAVSSPRPVTSSGGGHITYSLEDGTVHRIAAVEGAEPENISDALDAFSPGVLDYSLNISPNGEWMVWITDRFGCAGWECLAIVAGDLSSAEVVMAGGDVVHPEGFSAVSSDGNLIVYPAQDGTHTMDLWGITRQGDQWSAPYELTQDSSYPYNSNPAISSDGQHVIFNCNEIDIGNEGTSLCEVNSDGTGFRTVLSPNIPGLGSLTALFHPDYNPQGGYVFEGDLDGEQIWYLAISSNTPLNISGEMYDDNSPCVLPDGRIASLWLDRPGGPGYHELKIMNPDGTNPILLIMNIDIFDIGLGCGE